MIMFCIDVSARTSQKYLGFCWLVHVFVLQKVKVLKVAVAWMRCSNAEILRHAMYNAKSTLS